jgi:hypothetical protein
MRFQHLHAECMVGLDHDGPALARCQDFLAAYEDLTDRGAGEAQKQNFLTRLQCREAPLRLK